MEASHYLLDRYWFKNAFFKFGQLLMLSMVTYYTRHLLLRLRLSGKLGISGLTKLSSNSYMFCTYY